MILRLAIIWRRAIKLPRTCLVHCRAMLTFEESARADVARQASRSEGTARKAENVDLDPFFVPLRQKTVSAADVMTEPCACCSADDGVPGREPRSDAVMVIDLLVLDPMRGFELWIDQIPYTHDVGDLLAVVGVPRAIEAKNEPLEYAHGNQPLA